MNLELKQFYKESFLMGEAMFIFFDEGHPCHQLAKCIYKHQYQFDDLLIPDLNDLSHHLKIPQAVIEGQIIIMKKVIDEYFYRLQNTSFDNPCDPKDLKNKTQFLTSDSKGEIIAVKLDQDILLQIGEQVYLEMITDNFVDGLYEVTECISRPLFDGILKSYFLKPIYGKEKLN